MTWLCKHQIKNQTYFFFWESLSRNYWHFSWIKYCAQKRNRNDTHPSSANEHTECTNQNKKCQWLKHTHTHTNRERKSDTPNLRSSARARMRSRARARVHCDWSYLDDLTHSQCFTFLYSISVSTNIVWHIEIDTVCEHLRRERLASKLEIEMNVKRMFVHTSTLFMFFSFLSVYRSFVLASYLSLLDWYQCNSRSTSILASNAHTHTLNWQNSPHGVAYIISDERLWFVLNGDAHCACVVYITMINHNR